MNSNHTSQVCDMAFFIHRLPYSDRILELLFAVQRHLYATDHGVEVISPEDEIFVLLRISLYTFL